MNNKTRRNLFFTPSNKTAPLPIASEYIMVDDTLASSNERAHSRHEEKMDEDNEHHNDGDDGEYDYGEDEDHNDHEEDEDHNNHDQDENHEDENKDDGMEDGEDEGNSSTILSK